MKLYEITTELQQFLDLVEQGEIPAEAVEDTLTSLKGEFEDKANNIACAIKNLLADVDAIKAEEKNLAERRKVKENAVERMKQYLTEQMLSAKIDKLETPQNKISFRTSKAVSIENEELFVAWAKANNADLLTYKEPTINKTAIKQALSNGEYVEGATIVENKNIQIK